VAGFVITFSAGTVQVSKIIDGDGANLEFTVEVACQLASTAGTVTLFDAAGTIRSGQTLPVPTLTVLRWCYPWHTLLRHRNRDGGAARTEVDFDSYGNAAIVTGGAETQTPTITVTNTFDAPPPAPTPAPGPQPRPPAVPPGAPHRTPVCPSTPNCSSRPCCWPPAAC